MTVKRVRLADIIVCYKEFPHTDVVERAEDLIDLVLAMLRGRIKPVMSLYDCRQISSYPTTLPLMRAFVDRIKAMEGKDGILSISVVHCFPYADVPELSSRILVVTDNDKAKGDALAIQLGEELVSMRGKTVPEFLSIAGATTAALEEDDGPVVMAEPADNAGGGAPSDNTEILRHLVERGVVGRRPRSDLGPGRGAPVLRRRARRHVPAPIWRQNCAHLGRSLRCHGGCDRACAGLLAKFWGCPGSPRRLRRRARSRR